MPEVWIREDGADLIGHISLKKRNMTVEFRCAEELETQGVQMLREIAFAERRSVSTLVYGKSCYILVSQRLNSSVRTLEVICDAILDVFVTVVPKQSNCINSRRAEIIDFLCRHHASVVYAGTIQGNMPPNGNY